MAGKKKTRRKKRSKAAVVLCIIALALFGSGAMLVHAYYEENQRITDMRAAIETDLFYEGISVNGVSLAGMTKAQALEKIKAMDDAELAKFTATIIVDGREWKEVIPATANTEEIIDDAYKLGRSGDLEVRYNAVTRLKAETVNLETAYRSDPSRLRALVDEIAEQVDIEPVNATVSSFDVETKKFSFTDDSPGTRLDVDLLASQIDDAIRNERYPIEVTGVMVPVEAPIQRASLEARNGLISTFSTKTTSDSARNENIRLASTAIHGVVVQPGEVFSMNDTTGVRSPEKGYQEAGAYVGGRLQLEAGGGVCQVSTTLYNAIIKAGLEITERNNHSQTVSYVDKGEDAMINYPNRDFKFTNNSDGPVYIFASFKDRVLQFDIYGTRILGEGETIELRLEIVEEIVPEGQRREADPTMVVGGETVTQKPKTGYRTLTHVELYRNGEFVEELRSYKSYYAPVPETISYGTMTLNTGRSNVSSGGDGIPVIMP